MATSSVLKNLTMDQIREAFEKAKAEVNIPGVRLELITEEHYNMAMTFARENFMREEPITKALCMEWTNEYSDFWLGIFKKNLSLMLVDVETGDMIAIRATTITLKDDSLDLSSIHYEALRNVLNFCIYCDEQADFFGHFGIYEAIHFLGLSVNSNYTRRGYAGQIFSAAISMIRHLGIDPVYIKGEGSSNFSKKVYERSGMETLFELPFDEWVVNGKHPIQNTGIHKSMKVYGLKVTQNDDLKVSKVQ